MTAGKGNVCDFCARDSWNQKSIRGLLELVFCEFQGKGYVGKEIFRNVVAVSARLKVGKKGLVQAGVQ